MGLRRVGDDQAKFVNNDAGTLQGIHLASVGFAEHSVNALCPVADFKSFPESLLEHAKFFKLGNGLFKAHVKSHRLPDGTVYHSLANFKGDRSWEDYFIKSTESVVSYWGWRSFIILCEENLLDKLTELADAWNNENVIFGFLPTLFNWNGSEYEFEEGLSIAILPSLSSEDKIQIHDYYAKSNELHIKFHSTGIEKRLQDAGLKWFSLVPKWSDYSQGIIKVWLNPHDQNKYTSGYFSIEDLEEWILGKGPVLIENDSLTQALRSVFYSYEAKAKIRPDID